MRRGADAHPFAVRTVQAEDLDGLIVRRPEPVGGIELADGRVITAAGAGSAAAIAINADLVDEDVRNALES